MPQYATEFWTWTTTTGTSTAGTPTPFHVMQARARCTSCGSHACVVVTCRSCKKEVKRCNAWGKYKSDPNCLCSDCAPRCVFCKNKIDNGRTTCRRCQEYLIPESIEMGRMKDYNWKPRQWPVVLLKGESEEKERLFGLELEMERDEARPVSDDAIHHCYSLAKKSLGEAFIIKRDGSLQNGIELVLAPHSLNALRERLPELMDGFRKYGFYGFKTHRCGLHVHTQKVKPKEALSIKNFIAHNSIFFVAFSKRKYDELCRYAKLPEVAPDTWTATSKYCAVNDGLPETIEFRLFRGTTSSKSILASVECVKALIEYVRTMPGRTFYECNSPLQELRKFFVFAEERGYEHFQARSLRVLEHLKPLSRIAERQKRTRKQALELTPGAAGISLTELRNNVANRRAHPLWDSVARRAAMEERAEEEDRDAPPF